MTGFFRFPHTPHLAWLAAGTPRNDKVLAPAEAQALLAAEVIVEEKVDGANLGFSVDDHGELRAQNRGSYLSLEAPQGQWKPLKRWLACRRLDLAETLHPNLMLFGEWCYAVHSVRYTRLPDWFLVFDVYDGETGKFWSIGRRDALAQTLNLALVPRLGVGRYTLPELELLLAHSDLRDGPAEGLYVRKQEEGRLVTRAKLVHPEFVQAINEHWSKRTIEPNALAGDRREPWSWG